MFTTIIIIIAKITPYFDFGKVTPRILLGLNSLFSSLSCILLSKIKKGATIQVAPKF